MRRRAVVGGVVAIYHRVQETLKKSPRSVGCRFESYVD
jgi:hypothetical protein